MDIDDFATYLRAERRYSELTVLRYTRDVERFISEVGGEGDFDPALVTPDDLRNWISTLARSGKLKPQSINNIICSVRAWFRFLRMKGIVERDPLLKTGFLKVPKRLPVFVTESKMHKAVNSEQRESDFLSLRDDLIITVLYSTGIRLAELISIDRQDIDSGMTSIKVHGKGGKERIVPLIDAVKTKIERYLTVVETENICTSDEKPLFLSSKGARISRGEVGKVVERVLTIAGVTGKRSPHVLRHTFATHMMENGAGMRDIQELLGHSSLATTQVYTHTTMAKLKQAYDKAHPRGGDKKKER